LLWDYCLAYCWQAPTFFAEAGGFWSSELERAGFDVIIEDKAGERLLKFTTFLKPVFGNRTSA